MRQLAREAGVSVAAMSNALSGKGKLASTTRKRLRALADERGYRPRPALAALSGLRRVAGGSGLALIGFLADRAPDRPEIVAAALNLGYHTLPIRPGSSDAPSLHRHLLAAGAVGLVLGRCERTDLFLHPWTDLAVVCSSAVPPGCPYHRVGGDSLETLWRAWLHLLGLGCRRIGAVLFAHRPSIEDDHARLGAMLAAQRGLGGGAIPPFTGGFADAEGVANWAAKHRPDGLIAFHHGVRGMGGAALSGVPMVSLHLARNDLRQTGFVIDEERYAAAAIRVLDASFRQNDLGPSPEPLAIRLRPLWRDRL